jgi:hypothetical protein
MYCKKCGQEMKKSGPYAKIKDESQETNKNENDIYYWCMNPDCPKFQKNITKSE